MQRFNINLRIPKLMKRQALFINILCSSHFLQPPLHRKQTDIEQNWAASEVTFVSALLTSAWGLLFSNP